LLTLLLQSVHNQEITLWVWIVKEKIAERVAEIYGIKVGKVFARGRQQRRVSARSLDFNYLRASPFIDVFATARKNGFTINVVRTSQDPQHYFGLVLVE
jgi:hypothetical protein